MRRYNIIMTIFAMLFALNPTKSVTATVVGVLITANISGLKKGTTYYVKCVATGKGGTTTTGTTKVITNY